MDRAKPEAVEAAIAVKPEDVIPPIPNLNAPPPFLSKTYDMVDDLSTDAIISWSSSNNSFVVWNPPELGDLLPKYFKHSNFSSFVRQLNTYGFKKIDPDRWEFANEGFLRGQKHLLKTIRRRKLPHVHNQLHAQQSQNQNSACVEVGKFGLEEEVERLKRDKNVLMQELVRLRQQQQGTDNQLQTMTQRLQGMEQRQQQMMSFLAKAVQSPGFFAQFVQQQSESKQITESNKKRRIKPEHISKNGSSSFDGQIVKYHSYGNDTAKVLFRQLCDPAMELEKSASSEALCRETATGIAEDQSSPVGNFSSATSNQQSQSLSSLSGTHKSAASCTPPEEIINALPPYPDMPPDSIVDVANDELLLEPIPFEANGDFSLDFDTMPVDSGIDAFFNEDDELWDVLNAEPEEIDIANIGTATNSHPTATGNMDLLTEQMGLLSSDPKKNT